MKSLRRAQKDPQTFIEWNDNSEKCIPSVKKALMTAPVLGLLV
jgi:hypothetical protein